MQKYALKCYKIKQMFIFTLTKIAICYKILISVIFERIVVTMGLTLTEKILKAHLVDGEFVKGQEIGIRIDQTLTQDATGTMAYLEYEAMGVPRVRTEKSVAYIDHNTLQSGFENADDHRFIGSVCKKHGIYFSRPGKRYLSSGTS